jgi:hypothetical protein
MNERLNRATRRETIVPVFQGEPRHTCALYPDCECGSDCTAGDERRRAIAIAIGLAVLTAALAAGLVIWSLHT